MRIRNTLTLCVCGLALTCGSVAYGQTQASASTPPPKIWTVEASAGLTFTSGNTDTSTVNGGYKLVYDRQHANVVKSDALVLYGRTAGVTTTDRADWTVRDEYKMDGHWAVFGANEYLRDTFKDIRYLVAPAGGLSYHLGSEQATYLEASGGVGGVWERDVDTGTEGSGAITADQKFARALSKTATFTESLAALWKTHDFGDALYTTELGVAASMSTHTQLKVDFLDTYKHEPPDGARRNDIATMMAFVYKR